MLMVLFDHLCRHYQLDRIGRVAVADIGIFGVLLFFVHTSLVLMYSMERSALSGLALIKNFYVRRFFRIYPLSVLTVLAAVALHLYATGRGIDFGPRPGAFELISNLLLIQNLTYSPSVVGPLWTLPLEVQMYLLLPFLFLWRKRSFLWLLVLWVVCGLLGHYPQVIPSLAWFTLLLYIPNFLPGVMAFTLPHRPLIPAYWWPPLIVSDVFVWDLLGTLILHLVRAHSLPELDIVLDSNRILADGSLSRARKPGYSPGNATGKQTFQTSADRCCRRGAVMTGNLRRGLDCLFTGRMTLRRDVYSVASITR